MTDVRLKEDIYIKGKIIGIDDNCIDDRRILIKFSNGDTRWETKKNLCLFIGGNLIGLNEHMASGGKND